MNANLSDPLFHIDSYFGLTTEFIATIYRKLVIKEQQRINAQSATNAYICTAIYSYLSQQGSSKNRAKAKSLSPADFLPFQNLDLDGNDKDKDVISRKTAKIFCELLTAGLLPEDMIVASQKYFDQMERMGFNT